MNIKSLNVGTPCFGANTKSLIELTSSSYFQVFHKLLQAPNFSHNFLNSADDPE